MAGIRGRFRDDLSERACQAFVHSLIDVSIDNWRTRAYDAYQQYSHGIAS
jgi:phosphatidylinositol kinase/protein kinase (PI-3  family)